MTPSGIELYRSASTISAKPDYSRKRNLIFIVVRTLDIGLKKNFRRQGAGAVP